jgi:hypothetical protein
MTGVGRLYILVVDIGSGCTNTWDVLWVDGEDDRGTWALGMGRGSWIRCVAMGGEGEEYKGMTKLMEDRKDAMFRLNE